MVLKGLHPRNWPSWLVTLLIVIGILVLFMILAYFTQPRFTAT